MKNCKSHKNSGQDRYCSVGLPIINAIPSVSDASEVVEEALKQTSLNAYPNVVCMEWCWERMSL